MQALRVYTRLLERYPIQTKSISCMVVTGLGDFGTQSLVDERRLRDIDVKRVLRFAGIGLFAVGPLLHVWYGFLARQFPQHIWKRVLADQFGFAPAFLGSFIFVNDFAQSHDWKKSAKKVESRIVETMKMNWMIWIPFQALNFNFIPLPYQVLANNTASVLWNGYLSWNLHRHEHHEHDHQIVAKH